MAIVAKIVLILLTFTALSVSVFALFPKSQKNSTQISPTVIPTSTPIPPKPTPAPKSYIIPMKKHVVQTFNNCGPASLSMLLSYNGLEISQQDLGLALRPWQNPAGINDDKNVFLSELATKAKDYDLLVFHLRDGDLETLKHLISNDIPVLVRTYLHPQEDIGHFRIVRGYNDNTSTLTQDDSYEGKNITYSYDTFLQMWKPFNYEYLILVPKVKEELVTTILGPEFDEQVAWQNSYSKAKKEVEENPDDISAEFNLSVSAFHLKKYTESVEVFEKIENRLSKRTLWYQIEPIEAYLQTNNYERVLSLTDRILANNNLAFSELYLLRAESYRRQGLLDEARREATKALLYNKNLPQAIEAESSIEKNTPLISFF